MIVSENLDWSDFSRINLFLHELEGVEPIVSVARTYPDNSSAHILGYVSQISAKDLQTKEYLQRISCTRYGNWKNWFGKKTRRTNNW